MAFRQLLPPPSGMEAEPGKASMIAARGDRSHGIRRRHGDGDEGKEKMMAIAASTPRSSPFPAA